MRGPPWFGVGVLTKGRKPPTPNTPIEDLLWVGVGRMHPLLDYSVSDLHGLGIRLLMHVDDLRLREARGIGGKRAHALRYALRQAEKRAGL